MNIPNVSVAAIAAQALIEEAEEEEGHVAFDFVANNDDDMDEPPAPIAMDLPDEHSSSNIQSYEDICRSHVEQYLATAQAFVQESALGQKVNEWAKKIAPVLEEQESRPSFDIHHYGDKLMTRFGEEGKRISVEVLMGEQEDPMFEVCRNFVAVLQLVRDISLLTSSSIIVSCRSAANDNWRRRTQRYDIRISCISHLH